MQEHQRVPVLAVLVAGPGLADAAPDHDDGGWVQSEPAQGGAVATIWFCGDV